MTQSKHNEITADRARLAEILSHLSPSALVKLLYFAMFNKIFR